MFRTVPLEPFAVASESLRLGEIVVHYTAITGQRWIRDRAMLRSWAPDALTVALTLAGEAQGMLGERAFRTGPGSVQLCDLGQSSRHVSSASRTILVIIPRAIAAARGLDVAALHGAVLDSGTAAMLAPHLLGVREISPRLTVEEAAMLGGTFLDLLVLAVAPKSCAAGPQGTGRAATAWLARQAIERRLGSPALTIGNLCRELGVSRTTLHRCFDREGGVQAYIRERRLEAARALLSDPRGSEPIYAIAERLGFSDAAHLSRLFRARFGLSPRDQRAGAAAEPFPGRDGRPS